MHIFNLIIGSLVLVALVSGCTSKGDFPPFNGQVNVKLIVKGEPSQNVADVLVYKEEDISAVRQKLINELGPNLRIKDDKIKSLPFLTITKATANDLNILEQSEYVEFFYSDELRPLGKDPVDDRGSFGKPRFQWIYSKQYGYQIGTSPSPYAKNIDPELVYEIYRSKGKKIPKEILQ
ncbi:MAG: hypothetical protein AABX25_04220 [Nanoarchaeota archaeon]